MGCKHEGAPSHCGCPVIEVTGILALQSGVEARQGLSCWLLCALGHGTLTS